MTNQHPITPPPELVQQWREESSTGELHFSPQYLATRAAQWGADQELEACAEWLKQELQQPGWANRISSYFLYAARRWSAPSLKERLSKAIIDGDERKALKLLEELDDSL